MSDNKGLPNTRPAPYKDQHDPRQNDKSKAHEASLRKIERLARKGQS